MGILTKGIIKTIRYKRSSLQYQGGNVECSGQELKLSFRIPAFKSAS